MGRKKSDWVAVDIQTACANWFRTEDQMCLLFFREKYFEVLNRFSRLLNVVSERASHVQAQEAIVVCTLCHCCVCVCVCVCMYVCMCVCVCTHSQGQ